MKTFNRLVPEPHLAGRFISPHRHGEIGMYLLADGSGLAWRGTPRRPNLDSVIDLPPALTSLVFASLPWRRIAVWLKLPGRPPFHDHLVLVISIREKNGRFLNIGWGSWVHDRSDGVDLLATCPCIDAVWILAAGGLLDNRHGRIVSLGHYAHRLKFPWTIPAKEVA